MRSYCHFKSAARLAAAMLGGVACACAVGAWAFEPPRRLPPVHAVQVPDAPPPPQTGSRGAAGESIQPDATAPPANATAGNARPSEQRGDRLSLAALEEMALSNNPTLAQAGARIDAARGAYLQAGLRPNPRLGYEGAEIGNEGRQGMQGGYVAQEIITGGKLQLNQAVACQAVMRSQREFEAQRLRVLTDVRSEFYRALAAQRRRELAEEVAGLGGKSLAVVKDLIVAGTATDVDLLQARIEVESTQLAVEAARNRHAAAWRRLAGVTGMPDMEIAPLDGDLRAGLPTLEWDAALARLLTESPELATARIDVQRAVFALRRTQRQNVPDVDVMVGVQKDFASGDTVANVQLEMPIPLWNRNQGNIAQARAELIVAETEVARLELSLRNRLAGAFERYANARQQVDRYAIRILPDAKEALNLTVRAYQNGQVGFLNVLNAQRTYFQANITHLDAVSELRDTVALVDGLMLEDSLQVGKAMSVGGGEAAGGVRAAEMSTGAMGRGR